MKVTQLIYPVLFLIGFTSCTDTIENFRFKDIDPKIVIHGAISSDNTISVNLTRSLSLNEAAKYIPLEEGRIKLVLDSEEVGVFTHDSNGWYSVKGYTPQTQKVYTIIAENDGYETASIDFTIPENPEIALISWEKLIQVDNYNGQYTYIAITVTLADNSTTTDYYTLSMRGDIFVRKYYIDGIPNDYYYNEDGFDSVVIQTKSVEIPVVSSDNAVKITKSRGLYSLADQGNDPINRELLFITDENFNRSENQVHLKIFPINFMTYAGNFIDTTQTLWINVSKISETYYKYALNTAKVQMSNGNPLVEPVTPYNPVDGGLGLVYGYNEKSDSIKVEIREEDLWGWYVQ